MMRRRLKGLAWRKGEEVTLRMFGDLILYLRSFMMERSDIILVQYFGDKHGTTELALHA